VYDPTTIGGQLVGVALTVAGIACCAAYTVITRPLLPGASETSQVVLSQQAHALVLAVVLSAVLAVLGGSVAPTAPTTASVVSAVLSGVLYYAGAYWLYLGALRRVPASVAAASFYLIPIVGVAGGWLLLGERLGVAQWIGVALVLVSVIVILTRSSSVAAPMAVRASEG
jgi:drug/metabolite transporter (DMT)-like permease